MKTILMMLGAVYCTAAAVSGAEPQVNADITAQPASRMTADPAVRYYVPLTLGKRNIEVTGPLVETFRRPPQNWSDMNLGDKLTAIPVIGLFVPQPMPRPPATRGRYFVWGGSDRAWSDIADPGMPGPRASLVSFSMGK
jgi:hypothetical protein